MTPVQRNTLNLGDAVLVTSLPVKQFKKLFEMQVLSETAGPWPWPGTVWEDTGGWWGPRRHVVWPEVWCQWTRVPCLPLWKQASLCPVSFPWWSENSFQPPQTRRQALGEGDERELRPFPGSTAASSRKIHTQVWGLAETDTCYLRNGKTTSGWELSPPWRPADPLLPGPEHHMQACVSEIRGAGASWTEVASKGKMVQLGHALLRPLPNLSKILSSKQCAHLNKWRS